jgi:hypothetical protein
MKLKQLIEAEGALHKLMNTPLPAAVAFRLKRVIRVVQPELQAYEEQRLKLVHELGEKGEDGRTIVTTENMPAFNEQLEALWAEEVELNFKPMLIGDLGNTAVTAADLLALDWLFVDEE